jgi:hypothetical protein
MALAMASDDNEHGALVERQPAGVYRSAEDLPPSITLFTNTEGTLDYCDFGLVNLPVF